MSNYLVHHGILGQKWGVRRFQNPNGSLTAEGKKHYGSSETSKTVKTDAEPRRKKLTPEQREKIDKALKIGAVTVATSLAAYGAYKMSENPKVIESISKGKTVLKNEAADYKRIVKESAKQTYKGFKEGLPEGAANAGKAMGKVVAGGAVWMAGVKMADLATNGAVTNTIIPSYNGHVKKDNRVKAINRSDD